MGAIAERPVVGMLAGAEGMISEGLDREGQGLDIRVDVGAIAEGLGLGASTGAPEIGTGREVFDDGMALGDERFRHGKSSSHGIGEIVGARRGGFHGR
jgi:hypothetical protein